jgi:hypothetical protein
MSTLLLLAGAAALALAAVHAVVPAMRFLSGTPRSVWLSIAGGVSVAYVFVHLLPELAAGQEDLGRALRDVVRDSPSGGGVRFAERHVYLIALTGLTAFYGLDKLAKRSRGQTALGDAPRDAGASGRPNGDAQSGRDSGTPSESATSPAVFWIHMTSFGVYNALVGYLLLHRETPGLASLGFFAVAMALHFVVTDFGLTEDHKARYQHVGRWVLAAAVLGGFAAGAAIEVPKAALAVLVAFLAGGVILNVLKEEVPNERQSRFWAFGLGLAGYTLLLLTL